MRPSTTDGAPGWVIGMLGSASVPPRGKLACGVLTVGVATGAIACDRAPRDVPCPPAAVGALVITELRGAQVDEADTGGQWIELANTSGDAIPLAGLLVRLRRLDGSGEVELLVRDAELAVPAGARVVLGRFPSDDLPAHADYGYADDYEGELHGAGLLELESCGTLIDRASWMQLPQTGTLGLDGAIPPDAEANDTAASWCEDPTPAGTPAEDNPSCA